MGCEISESTGSVQPAKAGRPPLAPSSIGSPIAPSVNSGSTRSRTGSVSSKESEGDVGSETELPPTPLDQLEAIAPAAEKGQRIFNAALVGVLALPTEHESLNGTMAQLLSINKVLKSVHLHCTTEGHGSSKKNPVGDGCDLRVCSKGWVQQILTKLLAQVEEF